MNNRVVPYDLDYNILNKSRKIAKWLLVLTFIFSFSINVINELNIQIDKYYIDFLLVLSILFIIFFTILSIINDYILFPSSENKRRTKYLDASFDSNLSLENIDPNFYNPELTSGIYKLAVNGFENCFFTYNIGKSMIPKKIFVNSILFMFFIIFAYFGFKNFISYFFVFLQLFLSGLFLNDLVRFLIYHQRNYQYFNKYNLLFNRIGSDLNLGVIPEILKHILDYECNLNWGMISLDSKIYNREVEKLNNQWEETKNKLGIAQSNSITTF